MKAELMFPIMNKISILIQRPSDMRVVSALMAIPTLQLRLTVWITKPWQCGRCLGGRRFAFGVLITSLIFIASIRVPPSTMLIVEDCMTAARVFLLLSGTLFRHIDKGDEWLGWRRTGAEPVPVLSAQLFFHPNRRF